MQQFDEQGFSKRIYNLGKQRIQPKELRDILAEFGIEQHIKSINNLIERMDMYRKGKQHMFGAMKSFEVREAVAKESDEDEEGEESEAVQEEETLMSVTCEEAKKCANLLMNKIKYSIWKVMAQWYGVQHSLVKLSKKTAFAIKDPGHFSKINVLVGEEQKHYTSYVRVNAYKKPTKVIQGQEVVVKVKVLTGGLEESKKFCQLWDGLYEFVKSMAEGELSDGASFMNSLDIKKEATNEFFQVKLTSHNPEINELAFLITGLPDITLKTEVKFKLDFLLEFLFDLGKLIKDKTASLYDFLGKNLRIKLGYLGSQYVSALKQLMIADQSFKDLSYVNDDQQSLLKILLVSLHVVQLNVKFKNSKPQNAQQDTLRQILGMIMQEVRPMLQNMKEESPDVYELLIKAMKKEIIVDAQIYDLKVDAELYLQNVDTLLLENAQVMEGAEGGNDSD